MNKYSLNDKAYYSIINKSKIILSKSNEGLETLQARVVLKDMLNRFDVDLDKIIINENGKPYFKNLDLFFNYSHSKNYIACVISNYEVGIDIEEKNRIISDDISKKYLDGVENNNDRLTSWVKKESYSKMKGLGLQIGFNSIDFDSNCKNILINNKNYICSIFCDNNNIDFVKLD